jgi:hypothetical protein
MKKSVEKDLLKLVKKEDYVGDVKTVDDAYRYASHVDKDNTDNIIYNYAYISALNDLLYRIEKGMNK